MKKIKKMKNNMKMMIEESKETSMKPPVKARIPTEAQAKMDTNEGMEGTADGEKLFPHKVDASCKFASLVRAQLKGLGLKPT